MPICQLVNPSKYIPVNSSACSFLNLLMSTRQLVNLSTFQLLNLSIFELSTCQHIVLSIHQSINLSTYQLVNLSILKLSTCQHIILSIHQSVNLSTCYFVNLSVNLSCRIVWDRRSEFWLIEEIIDWLIRKDVVGRARGFLPYVGIVTIVMNDYPRFK